jgi:ATP-dependent RNA helicase RhlE
MSHANVSHKITFSGLGLAPKLLHILARLQFETPTPIQHKAIPVAAEGKDIIGIAQTGTGKTLAFVLPLLQQIAKTKKKGLIILPTRELAGQVDETLHTIGHSLGLRRALLIGGASMHTQIRDIRRHPHVYIGTPGRINDHLQGKTLQLQNIGVLVLDEADRMLDMGFEPQITQILRYVPKQRQTMLFSATMPAEIVKIAAQHMKMPVRVEVARAGSVADKVDQELFVVTKDQKNRLLQKLLAEYTGTILIFSRTKYGAKKICKVVRGMGHAAAEIHSNLSLSQRKKSLQGFKSGAYRVLVATDIAARGIDVTDIELVINYDLPDNPDDYVHRVGRTGRAGKVGMAISFITPDQRAKVRVIERLVRQSLKMSPLPDLPAHIPMLEARPVFNRGHRHLHPRRKAGGGRHARVHSSHLRTSHSRRQPKVHI